MSRWWPASIAAIAETPAQAIIISSEALEGLLRNRQNTETFFNRIRESKPGTKAHLVSAQPAAMDQLELCQFGPKLSAGLIRSNRARSASLNLLTPGSRGGSSLAETHGAELIARPFSKETIASRSDTGISPEHRHQFTHSFEIRAVRRNEAVGPFTVSVAREVLRAIRKGNAYVASGEEMQDGTRHISSVKTNGTDSGYCGLSTALARHVEEELRPDNDVFAQRVWGKSWADVFAADVDRRIYA